MEYDSVLKIPDFGGLGRESCFFGANDEVSWLWYKKLLPPVPINLVLMFIRLERSLVLLF